MISPTVKHPGPLVVKIGGAGVDDPAAAPELWRAIASMHQSLKGSMLLVHGGGSAVDQHLARLGMTTQRREGIRITPMEQAAEVAAVLAGRVNKLLVGAIQTTGVPAVGLCLGDGLALECIKADSLGFDAGRVGEVVGGDGRLLQLLMEHGFLPVLSSIGLDRNGQPLNINADDAAAGVARILGARLLVLLTDVPGIRGEHGERIESATFAELESLVARGIIHGGMIPKVRAAMNAARHAGAPAIIASWKSPGDLMAVARGQSAGTRIVPDAPQPVPAAAVSPVAQNPVR